MFHMNQSIKNKKIISGNFSLNLNSISRNRKVIIKLQALALQNFTK